MPTVDHNKGGKRDFFFVAARVVVDSNVLTVLSNKTLMYALTHAVFPLANREIVCSAPTSVDHVCCSLAA